MAEDATTVVAPTTETEKGDKVDFVLKAWTLEEFKALQKDKFHYIPKKDGTAFWRCGIVTGNFSKKFIKADPERWDILQCIDGDRVFFLCVNRLGEEF